MAWPDADSRRAGGEQGASRIEGILNLPKQSAGGRPAYPGLFDKAAVLFRSFILNHPFVDGNKRMGAAAAIVFLDVNDHVVCCGQQELVELALAVATGREKSLSTISDWFRERTLRRGSITVAAQAGELSTLLRLLPGGFELSERPLLYLSALDAEETLNR